MALKDDLKKSQIIVAVVPNSKYASGLKNAITSASGSTICYVSLNKPYNTVAEQVGPAAKNFIFIDCVSGTVAKPKGYKVFFVSSPKALTELSITLSDVMKKVDVIIFDALSTLIAFGNTSDVIKFVHAVVTKVRSTKTKCIFMALKEDTGSDVMKDVAMFVDKIEKM